MSDLPRSAGSLWRKSYPGPSYPKLKGEVQVDTVVIGAGITGLTTAYLLKQAGQRVAVLDKDTVGGGTTGRTTGKVTAQHGLIYNTLHERFGAPTARTYAEAASAAVEKVREITASERIDCGLETQDNYVFTTDASQVEKFRQEAEVAQALGLPASFETTSPLPFDILAAVKFTDQAYMNAQKYVLGLAAAVHGGGSFVFEHSSATDIRGGKPCHVGNSDGTVVAKDIVVATSVPTLPLLARATYCLLEYPEESYIVAGRLPGKLAGMYISPDKDNYSILPVNFGGDQLLLVGGEGHISGLRGSTHSRYLRLATYAHERFGVTELTHRWSDRDYRAYDDLPLIGRLYLGSRHTYVATAYRKWGLTSGTVAGMVLSDQILGKPNPWASIYSPHRLSNPGSIPRVAWEHLTGSS